MKNTLQNLAATTTRPIGCLLASNPNSGKTSLFNGLTLPARTTDGAGG